MASKSKGLLIVAIIVIAIITGYANAYLIKPVGATASSYFGVRYPTLTIDGSGIADVNGNSVFGDFGDTHINIALEGYYWTTNPGDAAPEITFDLGGLYDVTSMRIWNWNYTGLTDGGVKDVDVYVGATLGSMALVGSYAFNQADGIIQSPRYTFG